MRALELSGVVAAAFVSASALSADFFVDADAPLGGDGAEWATAFRYLQDALYIASQNEELDLIRVAEGTYYPDETESAPGVTPGDPASTFNIPNETIIRGGFRGLMEGESPF